MVVRLLLIRTFLGLVLLQSWYKYAESDKFADLTSRLWAHTEDKNQEDSAFLSQIVPESDIRDPNRKIWIITTASLPWMTGTSINPLLRAAYLARDRPAGNVQLLIPWLGKEDQENVFPADKRFKSPDEQKEFILQWLREEADMPIAAKKLNISYYTGRYHDEYHSIFPMGDLVDLIPDHHADICILEEPEHLNWFKAPFTEKTWLDKFNHVIGIMHTNYLMYSRHEALGALKENFLFYLNQGMCRAYCNKIIKLSGALQEFAEEKEVISNVHGVRSKFLEVGDVAPTRKFTKGAYFLGKMAWAKGLKDMYKQMEYVRKRTGSVFELDAYGNGPHLEEIKKAAQDKKLPVTFHDSIDHSLLPEYRVFVNPSTSEVLCTTIVEALAMGKWVVCAKHPSNEFFEQFPNCLTFSNGEQFAANVFWALNHDPYPLSREHRYTLSWDAAMDRLQQAALLTRRDVKNAKTYTDRYLGWIHEMIGSGSHGDVVRMIAGGRSVASQIEYVQKYGSAHPVTEEDEKRATETVKASGELLKQDHQYQQQYEEPEVGDGENSAQILAEEEVYATATPDSDKVKSENDLSGATPQNSPSFAV